MPLEPDEVDKQKDDGLYDDFGVSAQQAEFLI